MRLIGDIKNTESFFRRSEWQL